MANSAAIRAGKAFVELFVQDNLPPGLAKAKKRLQAWSKTLGMIGAGLTGIGIAILSPLLAAANSFAAAGSELNDLSTSTGMAVNDLHALDNAAGEAGTSLETLHGGLRGMAKFTAALAGGNKVAAATLTQLGISSAAFLAASPIERLGLVADGLQNIRDPSLRSALAMRVLGKSGEELQRILAGGSKGLDEMMARARHFGGVFTEEDAQKADALGDAWDHLKAATSAAWNRVGAAIAEPLTQVIEYLAEGVVWVRTFIEQNQGLIRVIAGVGVGLVIAGNLFLGLSAAVYAASIAIEAYNVVMWLYTAATSAAAVATAILESELLLPVLIVGLIAAGLIAGVAAWMAWTEAGQWTASTIGAALGDLWGIAQSTFGGILDALMTGDWNLAGEVAMAGLNAAWERGMLLLKQLWIGFRTWFLNLLSDLSAALPRMLAGAQANLLNFINELRARWGLSALTGSQGINDWAKSAQSAADKAKAARNAAAEAEMKAAAKPFEDAQKQLEEAVAKAGDKRKAVEDERERKAREERERKKAQQRFGLPGGLPSETVGSTGLGTFSAAVVRFLGVATVDDQKRTADATEEMNGKMDDLIDAVEAGGLEWAGG